MSEEMINTTQRAEETVQTGQENAQELSDVLNKKKKPLPFIVAAAAVLIAIVIGIVVYSAPAGRLQKQLDLGYRYLSELDYEQAVVAFEAAISIDERCLEAYAGGLEAYLGAGDTDNTQDFYDRTLAVLSEMEDDLSAENMDYAVEIYLASDEIYGDDLNRIAQVLEKGYAVTGEDSRIKSMLVENYIQTGRQETQKGSYEEALTVYDRLLELDSTNTETINGLCDCLNEYIDRLMESGQYDKIRELAEKYGDVAGNVDFASISERIEFMGTVRGILVRIAAFCEEEDYENVFALMQSEEYEDLLVNIDKIEETHGIETEYGRIGIYKVDSEDYGNYMIYYGEYEGDKRQGHGAWLGYYNGNNYMAQGDWADDLPQGEFTVREWTSRLAEDVVYRVISGNVNGGLWNGDVLWKFERTDEQMTFPVTFENGNWVVLRQEEDGDFVVSEDSFEGTGGDMVIHEEDRDKKHGIAGFGE